MKARHHQHQFALVTIHAGSCVECGVKSGSIPKCSIPGCENNAGCRTYLFEKGIRKELCETHFEIYAE